MDRINSPSGEASPKTVHSDPEEVKTFSFNKLLEKKALVIAGVLLILLIFIALRFVSHHGKERHMKPAAQERKVYRETDLNQMLSRTKPSPLSERKQEERAVRKPRNYATEMAVFIFEEKAKRSVSKSGSTFQREKLGLPAGTKIPAYLSGSLFSFNVAAPVTVIIAKNIEKNGNILIPKGSQFLGEADVLKSLNRINVHFDLLIFPDGKQIRVRAMALSEDGSAGIKGRVNKHRDMRILKAIGEAGLAGVSLFAGGVSSQPYAFEDQLRMNLAQNLTQGARQDLRSVKVETSVTVDSFTPMQVILLEAV